MKQKIMIVDDEQSNRFLLDSILCDEFETILIPDAQQMVEKLKTCQPDLILLDVMMPVVSGFDAAKILTGDPVWKEIPIIFVTAKTSGKDVMSGFNSGGIDYIKKPIDADEILARVKGILGRVEENKRLKNESLVDQLTSLYNRRFFFNRIVQDVENYKRKKDPFCLALIDIDFFKNVNDTYGHPAGDQVLIQIAGRIRNSLRLTDIICRYGGEEFLVLFPRTIHLDALKVTQRLSDRIKNTGIIISQETVLQVTVSAGISEFGPYDTVESILERSDKALYESKNNGRDRITYQ